MILVSIDVGNYGLEATVERNFSKGYYLLLAGSVFNSRYRGSDNVWRNTTFNGRVSLNGVFAREFTFTKGYQLGFLPIFFYKLEFGVGK